VAAVGAVPTLLKLAGFAKLGAGHSHLLYPDPGLSWSLKARAAALAPGFAFFHLNPTLSDFERHWHYVGGQRPVQRANPSPPARHRWSKWSRLVADESDC
jgi:hypothetical protein